MLAAHRVPLFVLEACQSARTDDRAEGSVAARLVLDVRRFDRLAWLDAEELHEARPLLDELGRQLVAGWPGVAALERGDDLSAAVHRVQQALRSWWVLVVVDNIETALEDLDPALMPMLSALAGTGSTRLLLTSREAPPELDCAAWMLGRLAGSEGRELVEGVLKAAGLTSEVEGEAAEWVDRLVEQVAGHPRSLVLLAPEVARRGGVPEGGGSLPRRAGAEGDSSASPDGAATSIPESRALSARPPRSSSPGSWASSRPGQLRAPGSSRSKSSATPSSGQLRLPGSSRTPDRESGARISTRSAEPIPCFHGASSRRSAASGLDLGQIPYRSGPDAASGLDLGQIPYRSGPDSA